MLTLALLLAQPVCPLVIAHRGASGERPEHTLAAYQLAIDAGADFIEPDLVITRDGVLVARHENEIGGTTDIADHPEFAGRRTTKMIDGQAITGWFTEDFTLAELKTLRARERLPQLRPQVAAEWDDRLPIATFDEVLTLVAAAGRPVGVYPETKHPSYFRGRGTPLEEPLLQALARAGLDRADAPVFIQSFEVGNLRWLSSQTEVRLVQLVASEGAPADRPDTPYAALLSPAGLAGVARYAAGIGAEKALVLARDADGRSAGATPLVADAHRAGLLVHAWTFRRENYFLPIEMRIGPDPRSPGDLSGEVAAAVAAGVDGVFSDNPAEVVGARGPCRALSPN